jgi:WD40 repeat protein
MSTCSSGKSTDQTILELRRPVAATNGKIFTSASWSPDGRLIATGGGDADIEIWSADDLSAIRSLDVGRRGFSAGSQHSLAFSKDGRLLVGGSSIATTWGTADWEQKKQFIHPSGTHPQPFGIKSVTFSPNQSSPTTFTTGHKLGAIGCGPPQVYPRSKHNSGCASLALRKSAAFAHILISEGAA